MDKLIINLTQQLKITEEEFQIIKPEKFNERLESGGDLSLIIGEAYMNEEWSSKNLSSFFRKVIEFEFTKLLYLTFQNSPYKTSKLILNIIIDNLRTQIIDNIQNNQSIELSKKVGEEHYDIPDILYEYMLDTQRQYTCGYWKQNTKTLEESQINKINLLIDKLQIPDDVEFNVLDIGCGWGGLTNAISKRYPKCNIEGISISTEQIKYANDNYEHKKLKYYFCDYRDLPNKTKKYDRIISVGMFEHVGVKNYNDFFKICETILTNEGIFVLHTITTPNQFKYITGCNKYTNDKWLDKYIFPGSYIPTSEQILSFAHSQGLMYHHIQNLSISYAKTLQEWYNNFVSNWKKIKSSNPSFFTNKFYKMWELYLISCILLFETKQMQLNQYVFTKQKYNGMYIFTENK